MSAVETVIMIPRVSSVVSTYVQTVSSHVEYAEKCGANIAMSNTNVQSRLKQVTLIKKK